MGNEMIQFKQDRPIELKDAREGDCVMVPELGIIGLVVTTQSCMGSLQRVLLNVLYRALDGAWHEILNFGEVQSALVGAPDDTVISMRGEVVKLE